MISHNYISIDLNFSPNHAPKIRYQEQEASTEAGTSALAPFISAVSLAWAAKNAHHVTIESIFGELPPNIQKAIKVKNLGFGAPKNFI